MKEDIISISYGTGGKETRDFINKLFLKAFYNPYLAELEDSAIIPIKGEKITYTIDGHTISPIFFKGGDIGKLSITGTINDLLARGSIPKYIAISFIIEEGFSLSELKRIVSSIEEESKKLRVKIVTGDTKVLPRGSVDKIFIITAGIGEIKRELGAKKIEEGDILLATGTLGDHEAMIFGTRNNIDTGELKSDCEGLLPLCEELFESNIEIKAMRDPTRGGLSGVLNEWSNDTNLCFELYEDKIPIKKEVKALSELIGIEPYSFASEGRFIIAVKQGDEEKTLQILKKYNEDANIIGKVSREYPKKVILIQTYNTKRLLHPPSGEILPRIC